MLEILWEARAIGELEKLETPISKRIIKKVNELAENPHIKDIKKLKGMDGFRLRVGDYRVLFKIEKDKIHILKVGHRKHIYGR